MGWGSQNNFREVAFEQGIRGPGRSSCATPTATCSKTAPAQPQAGLLVLLEGPRRTPATSATRSASSAKARASSRSPPGTPSSPSPAAAPGRRRSSGCREPVLTARDATGTRNEPPRPGRQRVLPADRGRAARSAWSRTRSRSPPSRVPAPRWRANAALEVVGETGAADRDGICPGQRRLPAVGRSLSRDTAAVRRPQRDASTCSSPPQLDGLVAIAVALNDRVAAGASSYAVEPEWSACASRSTSSVSCRQAPLPAIARRALLLSNSDADRVGMLERACEDAGLRAGRLGRRRAARSPTRALGPRRCRDRDRLRALDPRGDGLRSRRRTSTTGTAATAGSRRERIRRSRPTGSPDASGRAALDRIACATTCRATARPDGAGQPRPRRWATIARNVHAQELVELLRRTGSADPASARASARRCRRLVRLEWRARPRLHGLLREIGGSRRSSSWRKRRARPTASEPRASACGKRCESASRWRATRPQRDAGG